MKRVTASAVVTLTVEIPAGQSWGPDVDMAQIHRQAFQAVFESLRVDRNRFSDLVNAGHVKILASKVKAILVEESE